MRYGMGVWMANYPDAHLIGDRENTLGHKNGPLVDDK